MRPTLTGAVAKTPESRTDDMVTWSDFVLDSVQAAVFTPDGSGFASGKAVGALLPAFRDRFGGDMQALPLPAGVPPEIPHVILQSVNKQLRLQMGPARTDYFWTNEPSASPPPLSDLIGQAVEVLDRYAREMPMTVKRLALVVGRVCPAPNPAPVLVERFCNEVSRQGPFKRSENFEIHNHKAYTPAGLGYAVNSWVRCKTGLQAPDNRPVILVEQDLNTLAEMVQSRRFSPADVRAFFETAGREMDEILRVYYPQQEGR